ASGAPGRRHHGSGRRPGVGGGMGGEAGRLSRYPGTHCCGRGDRGRRPTLSRGSECCESHPAGPRWKQNRPARGSRKNQTWRRSGHPASKRRYHRRCRANFEAYSVRTLSLFHDHGEHRSRCEHSPHKMMEQTNQPSPYFIRRTVRPENQTIDLHEFSVVEDQIHPLRDYWLIVKRHRWLILSCALALFIAATLYTFTRTPLYTAEATLLIERKVPQILKLRDTRKDSGDDDYSSQCYKTQYEILKSRALAERVARDEGLESHPVFGGGKTNETAKDGLVSGLLKELKNWAKGFMPAKPQPTPTAPDPVPLSARLA